MASRTTKKPRKVEDLRRFNVDFPLADMAAFKSVAEKKGHSMAAWARWVLRKAAGRPLLDGRPHKD